MSPKADSVTATMALTDKAAPVSALIICRDERDLIGECLESVGFCADIMVVDSGSTDGTLDIIEGYRARGYPIRLRHQDWLGYARQKQLALELASQPWCLVIDADERVDGQLRASIVAITQDSDPKVCGWYVRRRDWLAGYGLAHRLVLHNRILRLFRSGKARLDLGRPIHESFLVDGPTATIERGLLLHMRDLSIEDDVLRANRYSTLKAAMRRTEGRKPSTVRLVFSPPFTFLKFYLLKRYFLCGRPGFIYAVMMMIYSFLTEAKLFRARLDEDRSRSA
jgi:glycosyltransferase involved in cell wall biosynthesis